MILMRRVCFVLCLILCFSSLAVFGDGDNTAEYVYAKVSVPSVSSVGGEWALIGLARSGYDLPKDYGDSYISALSTALNEKNGELSRKYTDYSRVLIALAALGKPFGIVGKYNLLEKLNDVSRTSSQGLNGSVWALIALNACGSGSAVTDDYKDIIISRQNSDGGWSIAGGDSDPDMTAMALTALAPYKEMNTDAVDNGVAFLKNAINDNGLFSYGGTESSESSSQVIVALCSLGISPYEFSRNGGKSVYQGFESFKNSDGGFRHTNETDNSNQMATEQALLAYAAMERFNSGAAPVFDMSDVESDIFSDLSDINGMEKIEYLAKCGIVSGKSNGIFAPEDHITRAEFATIAVNALEIPPESESIFADVTPGDWFFSTVCAAFRHGIVNGVSETEFFPNELINREQAAVMLAGAAEVCGVLPSEYVNISYSRLNSRVSDWAADAFDFCINCGIFENAGSDYEPKKTVTRAEMAVMIYNLLEVGNKL